MNWVKGVFFVLGALGLGWWLPLDDASGAGKVADAVAYRIGDKAKWDKGAWRQWAEDRRYREVEAAYQKAWAQDVMAGVVLED